MVVFAAYELELELAQLRGGESKKCKNTDRSVFTRMKRVSSSCGRPIPLRRKRQWFQSRWLVRQEAIRARHLYVKQTRQTFTTRPRILTSRLGSQHLRSEDVNVLTLYISSERGHCSLFIRSQWRSSERILHSYVRRLIQLLHFVYRSCFAVSFVDARTERLHH